MNLTSKHVLNLMDDIKNNRITLPSLPEVAIKVRKFVDDPRMGMPQLSKVISTDPALAARLLQVANSPFFRCLNPSSNLKNAIGRLGGVCVRNIVTSLVMAQLYKTNVSGSMKLILKDNWTHSTKVASYCNVLAKRFSNIDAEQAMLAGLVHNIGVLPLLTAAGSVPELTTDIDALRELVIELHSDIGKLVLESWSFPEDMISAIAFHENLEREHEGPVDLVDIVMVGNLHALLGSKHPLTKTSWADIPAFQKLGLTPAESIAAMKEANAEIKAIQRLLSV